MKPKSKGVIYYTENRLNEKIANACREQLRKAFTGNIVSCSLRPIDFGDTRIVLPLEKGYLTMFKQILTALEASKDDLIFFCEHDVLYPKEHFDFTPPDDRFYYNHNWWKIGNGDLAVHWDADQVSGLVGNRHSLIEWYRNRINTYDPENFDRKFEPLSGEGSSSWKSSVPLIDIRHNNNLTYNKWKLDHFRKKETAVNFQQTTINKIPDWNVNELQQILL